MPNTKSEVLAGRTSVPQPNSAEVSIVAVEVVLPAALPLNDLLSLVDLPPGVELVDYTISAPQIDSNGTPTLAASIGHENAGGTDLAVVYETGLQFGRTANGSLARCANAAAIAADKTIARRVSLKVTTAAATYAGSGKKVTAFLHLRG